MKKNLIKSLKNLLKAYGGENSDKNNAIQIIDEITETLGGETTSKSKNLIEAIDKLSNQVSESSSNPNYTQSIGGTLDNPWGDVGFTALASAISNSSATAIITFTFNESFVRGFISCNSDSGLLYMNTADIDDSSHYVAAQATWENEGLTGALMVSNGTYADVTDMVHQVPTSLEIIWHPLPEASGK